MAEPVDAADSKSVACEGVLVRFRLRAPISFQGSFSPMNRRVRIHKPSKTTMQSGRAALGRAASGQAKAKSQAWVLEYELETKRAPEHIMGWVASGDTLNQVALHFSTAEQAVAYATAQGWDYDVEPARSRIIKGRTYLDNFLVPPVMTTVKIEQ